jgi:hypothetical protein
MPRLRTSHRSIFSIRAVWKRPAACVSLVVFVLGGALLLTRDHPPQSPLSSRAAINAALHDPRSAPHVRGLHWDKVSVNPIDAQLERVSFSGGGRVLAEFAVDQAGRVKQGVDFTRLAVPYGNKAAYSPALLLGLGLLWVVMTAVVPLRRIRNLDALAALSFLVPVILLQYRYVDLSVLASVPGLIYLLIRCIAVGLRPSRPEGPSTALFEHLTGSWEPAQRLRLLRSALIVLALVFVMVGVSSTGPVDVIYAVMEGATKIIHGALPYGHMPGDILHGDTYPVFSYVAYVPLAWLAPVNSMWDSVDVALAFGVLAALLSACGLARFAAERASFALTGPAMRGSAGGLRAALRWLSFPPLLIIVSTGTTDVVLAAILLFAVLLWRRTLASTSLLAIAGWFKLAPFVLIPLWLAPLRGRRLAAATVALAAVSLAMLGILVGLGGMRGPASMLHAVAYQFSRGSPQSLWSVLRLEWLQPLGEAGVLALIGGLAVQIGRDKQLASSPVRVAALSVAILVALELVANYWAFLYLVWIFPLVSMSLLTDPSLEVAAQPAVVLDRRGPVAVPA